MKISRKKMKYLKNYAGYLLLCCVILLFCIGIGRYFHTKGTFVQDTEEWKNVPASDCTIMLYMDGSDLESNGGVAAKELEEIQTALSEMGETGKTINLVVEAGGCSDWKYEPIAGNTYSRFVMTKDGVTNLKPLKMRNMGRAKTLTDFIDYATTNYPARHYGLIFWNHGAGPIQGFGSDENYENDALTLDEIRNGLAKTKYSGTYDFIAFDACDMACYEMATILEDKADYLIASEDVEPVDGFNYAFLKDIPKALEQEDSFAWSIGCSILDHYHDTYEEQNILASLSLIDLSRYQTFTEQMRKAVETVSVQWNEDEREEFFRQMEHNRAEIAGLNIHDPKCPSDLVDLKQFLKIFTQVSGDKESWEQLRESYTALTARVTGVGDPNRLSGMSIFLPAGSLVTDYDDYNVYDDIGMPKFYEKFVKQYQNYLEEEAPVELGTPSMINGQLRAKIHGGVNNIAQIYLESYFLTEDDQIAYLGSRESEVLIDEDGYLKAATNHTFWGLQGEVFSLNKYRDLGSYTLYLSPVKYNGVISNLYIYFDEENRNGIIYSVKPMEMDKQVSYLKEGDVVTPLYPYEVIGGDITTDIFDHYVEGKPVIMKDMEGGDGTLMRITLDADQCWYGFLIRDVTENFIYTDLIQ